MRSLYNIAIVLFVCLRDSPEAQCVDPDQSECITCLCEEWSDCSLYINSSSTVVTDVCADRTCNELPCLGSLDPIAIKCDNWAANIVSPQRLSFTVVVQYNSACLHASMHVKAAPIYTHDNYSIAINNGSADGIERRPFPRKPV